MVDSCQVDDCQKRLLVAEIERLREVLDAAIHLINGFKNDCPADLLNAAERNFEDRLTDLRAPVEFPR